MRFSYVTAYPPSLQMRPARSRQSDHFSPMALHLTEYPASPPCRWVLRTLAHDASSPHMARAQHVIRYPFFIVIGPGQ
jgi:hypothetical protein